MSATPTVPITFQGLIQTLNQFWAQQGCVLIQPLDLEVGAGTFHPATFLRAIGPESWNAAVRRRGARPTAATARTRTACSATTSTRWR